CRKTALANAINQYRRTRLADDRKEFKRQVRLAKRKFFDERIDHIANTTQRPWDLMDWTKQRQLPTHEAIKYQGEPCNSLDSLWDALHGTYNSASDRPTDNTILEETPREPLREWVLFSKAELRDELKKCSNTSAPGPDHITWYHLKKLCSNNDVVKTFTAIANACLTVGHWPSHFKESNLVILPKPGKPSYDTPKSFRPIVLLNTIGKLIEKMLANRMQFEAQKHSIFHPNQFGGIRQHSTEDAGVFLTHIVRAGWAKGLKTSVVAFDLAQFFPSVNHD